MSFNLFAVSLKNLKRKSFRTGILVFSLGLLVSVLVFGASFQLSISSTIGRATERLGADFLIVPAGAGEVAQEVLLESANQTFYMSRDILDGLGEIEGIEAYTHHTYLSTVLGVCCDVPPATIVAFDQETDFILAPWIKEKLGRKMTKGESIVGWGALDNLSLLDIDSSVLFNMKFDFIGNLDMTGTGLDEFLFILDENVPDMVASSTLELTEDMISVVFVRVKPGYSPLLVGNEVIETFMEADVVRRNEMGEDIIEVLRDINKLFIIILALSSLISIFLAWSVFSAIANERIREVGIMRSIGAKCSHVLRMFVFEVFLLGIMGSLLGVAIGTYMSIALSSHFGILRELSATMTVAERFYVGAGGLVIGTAICLIGAYSSIVRLRRLDPLMALKEV